MIRGMSALMTRFSFTLHATSGRARTGLGAAAKTLNTVIFIT